MKNIFLLLLALFALASCSDSNDALLEKLRTAVETENPEGYNTIDVSALTDFEWDRMFYFQGEQTALDIQAETGVKWEGASDVPKNHNRLLFMKGDQVVSYVDYNVDEFPLRVFGCENDRWIYPRNRSTFASFSYCLNDKQTYAFVPKPCLQNMQELINTKCDEAPKAE
ncbi:hypothetical protein H7F15_10470 [Pontibacter sp. Tf4]|uniref:hypothetical protein n=1 Tax=Pontibacter sp. Tf4 TaxID=2761620 RepID=UPI0016239647|nr:hypothetical protein [Pontibacter sp. Tf4]MBB6611460.1 hypothetical protein [Pontibacter sp. Tf4]